ncbi:hypothetical protein [Clostridium pasteurianum]|uniref:Uncharacterized protein n=1 Tax=Clostridium pasteurianum BC1 TaxID=86416 RepID=R4KC80_CLOPA|nr:hypothetical protein [Clostridium pasteurianum]AGK98129.1 hypothetical protein Clopa_3333 [Clostridium pasteurianum BC1]
MKKSLVTILSLFFMLNIMIPVHGEVNYSSNYLSTKSKPVSAAVFMHPILSIETVLEKDLGFSKEEVEKSKALGENAFDLAKKNGITKEQLKDSIIEVKCRKVDEVFNRGFVTTKLANMMKGIIKSRTEKWDGSF